MKYTTSFSNVSVNSHLVNQVLLIYEEEAVKSLLTTREKLIEEFEISRKNYATFSKEKGINPHTFTTWVYKWRKAKEEKTEVSFVKINTSILKKEAKIKIKKAE